MTYKTPLPAAEEARILGIHRDLLDEVHGAMSWYATHLGRTADPAALPRIEAIASWLQDIHETSTSLSRSLIDGRKRVLLIASAHRELTSAVTQLAWALRFLGPLAAYPGQSQTAEPGGDRQRVAGARKALRAADKHTRTAIGHLTTERVRLLHAAEAGQAPPQPLPGRAKAPATARPRRR